MGPYAKAGLGQGLAQGFQTMGMMLLDAQDRTERRAFQQYQVKEAARDRKERENDRQFQRWAQKEEYRIAGMASEKAEQTKREERYFRAQQDAADLQSKGFDAFVEPPPISMAGDPNTPGGLRQSTSMPAMPRMVVGGYNPERDPDLQRTKAKGEYFTGKGYGVEGQLPPRPGAPEPPPRLSTVTTAEGVFTFNPITGEYKPAVGPDGKQLTGKTSGDAELQLLDRLDGGGGEPRGGRRSFFGSGADAVADTVPSQGEDPALKALNSAHREGSITSEQHKDALTRYRTGKVTADQILGWLTGS